MARTELVKFRVTAAEKAYLVTQAGGARQLSAYLRDLALRGYEDEGGEQPTEDSESVELLPAAQPSADAGLPPLAVAEDDEYLTDFKVEVVKTKQECPRWMHHRTGTYCGSCKTVPK